MPKKKLVRAATTIAGAAVLLICAIGQGRAGPIDCKSASVSTPDKWPCIVDVDLGFALSSGGSTGPIQWNPKDPSDPTKKAHLWMRSGETLAIFVRVAFVRDDPTQPDFAGNALLFEARIFDHDEGTDDPLALGAATIEPAYAVPGDIIEHVDVGPILATMTRVDTFLFKQVASNGTIVESGNPLVDLETEDQLQADTLEVFAPDYGRLLEPEDGILVTEQATDPRSWTSASASFKLTVLLNNETPGQGWVRVVEPGSTTMILACALLAFHMLRRSRTRRVPCPG